MIIDRESSSADPPQQLRERKKELILEPKDCGGGAVMSYMESVCLWFRERLSAGSFLAGSDGGRVVLSSSAWYRVFKGSDFCSLSCLRPLQWMPLCVALEKSGRRDNVRSYARLTHRPIKGSSSKWQAGKQASKQSGMSFFKRVTR
jgi:hypothetical protein